MQIRVTQPYTKTVEIEGNRTAVLDVASIEEARRLFADGQVEWEDDPEEEVVDGETDLHEPEFEQVQEAVDER